MNPTTHKMIHIEGYQEKWATSKHLIMNELDVVVN